MTVAAVTKVGAHTAASSGGMKGAASGNDDELIIIMLVISAGLIFIDHDRSGKAQDGNQYVALGIVGFFLLVLDQFWPEVAVALAALFTVSIILNTPNGIPFVPSGTPGVTGASSTVAPGNVASGQQINPSVGSGVVTGKSPYLNSLNG